ncbi:hypothetical protein CAL26_01285 [Bordetella genomosp. 9]|uniref:DUF2934 domain-containing protein n=2 Tax=Bordetella TaxID=517 RepID=A0A261RLT2_9BORD|nr:MULTISPECIES: DUF2934 domain-containing protein [Bordetella]ARP82938.1 hypothetical protein CAL12_20380 [Bordetella genomosp. 8]OZI26018.1 hypothetical protein CAL26_01285 [Bordetella genomosp. 9]
MPEQLVDVLNDAGRVLHTYRITLATHGETADDAAYVTKALEAAASGHLVPDAELESLSARIHISRGGQLAPEGDEIAPDSETKQRLEQSVRERAYLLWEQAERPEGRADEFWYRALDEHLRERAYTLWVQAGRPEGGADQYWHQITNFQSQ